MAKHYLATGDVRIEANPDAYDYVHSIQLYNDNSTFEMLDGGCQRMQAEYEGNFELVILDETNGILKLINVSIDMFLYIILFILYIFIFYCYFKFILLSYIK